MNCTMSTTVRGRYWFDNFDPELILMKNNFSLPTDLQSQNIFYISLHFPQFSLKFQHKCNAKLQRAGTNIQYSCFII